MDRGDQENDFSEGLNGEGDRSQHWMPRPSGPGNSIHSSLHEPTKGPTYNCQKERLHQNQLRVPKRPRDVPRISKNCKGWDQSQQHCIPETNSHLQVRLVPCRIRRIQRQRLGVEIVTSKKSPLPCIEQLARTYGSNFSPWVDTLADRLKNVSIYVDIRYLDLTSTPILSCLS
jgi:hypothetical protein